MVSASSLCPHADIRKFDSIRCCLSCGEAVFELPTTSPESLPILYPDPQQVEAYTYQPLNYKLGQEVRLVVLHPGGPTGPIHCDIIHANLLDNPRYEALSYTWATEDGDSRLSSVIFCSTHTIRVSVNCEATLHRLRSPYMPKSLWVDMISIDQRNLKERNHQVGIMDQIYARACRVLVFIQDCVWDYSKAFAWLCRREKHVDVGAELEQFLSLRWFSRVWVIQEFALARSATLIMDEYEICLSAGMLQRLRKFCLRNYLPIPGPLQWTPGEFQRFDLLSCLSAARGTLSTEPRDKVFAILSLVDQTARSRILVDYARPLADICIDVAIACIMERTNLDILSHLEQSARNWTVHPSWAPTWRNEVPNDTMPAYFEYRYHGSWKPTLLVKESTEPTINLLSNSGAASSPLENIEVVQHRIQHQNSGETIYSIGTYLRVRAHLIDIIEDDMDTSSRLPWSSAAAFGRQLSDNKELWLDDSYSWIVDFFVKTEPGSERVLSAPVPYETTVTPPGTCQKVYRDPEVSDYIRIYEVDSVVWKPECDIRLALKKVFCNMNDRSSFLDDAKKWGHGKLMFQTQYSVGFARGGFQKGDVIFALDGARMPFILRNMGNGYTIVSDCYLWAALGLDCWVPGSKKGR